MPVYPGAQGIGFLQWQGGAYLPLKPAEKARRREEELRRHFPPALAQAWEIDVQAPSAFLRGFYDLDAGLFVGRLHEQAGAIGVSIQRLLLSLSKNVPGVVMDEPIFIDSPYPGGVLTSGSASENRVHPSYCAPALR